eukprot:11212417-Lingulodinium_polyedra.AAC.1
MSCVVLDRGAVGNDNRRRAAQQPRARAFISSAKLDARRPSLFWLRPAEMFLSTERGRRRGWP